MNGEQYSLRVFSNVDRTLRYLSDQALVLTPHTKKAPSLTLNWLKAFIGNYGSSRDIAITVVEKKGKLKLLAPFQIINNKSLAFLCDETADYNDLYYATPEVESIKVLIDYWLSQGLKKMILDQIPSDSITIDLFQIAANISGLKVSISPCDRIPITNISPNKPIEQWHGVNTSRIKKFQQSLEKLKQQSKVSFSLIESEEELIKELPNIMGIHIDRWKRCGLNSKFQDKRRVKFTYEVCQQAILTDTLFIPLMKVNGDLASYIICFKDDDTIYDWNTSFAHPLRKWSPGALLLLNTLTESKRLGFSKYNFMRGEESYKFFWTDKTESTVSISIEA